MKIHSTNQTQERAASHTGQRKHTVPVSDSWPLDLARSRNAHAAVLNDVAAIAADLLILHNQGINTYSAAILMPVVRWKYL